MCGIGRRVTAALLALGLLASGAWGARSETEVDVALVLAVDVSLSMETDEQELQRQGFVEAFRSPDVHEAIRKGALGRIAVVYVEWAGASYQEVIVPWTIIAKPEDAMKFSSDLAQRSISRIGYTSISGAIDFGVSQLQKSGVQATRKVIDVSGDGPNNQGRNVTRARDDAVALGITINGLPIMLKRPDGFWDIDNLDHYYRDCVIAGSGAFMIPVRDKSQFTEAIRGKIIREIAVEPALGNLAQQARAEPPADCLAGENRSGRRMRN